MSLESDFTLNKDTHIVITGAGPAGSASAIRLLAHGFTVTLIDEQKPGLKIGESLPGAAMRLLNALGIKSIDLLLSPEQFHPCVGNSSAWGNDQWSYADAIMNPEAGGWHIDRAAFNQALTNYAIQKGAVLLKGKVESINATETDSNNFEALYRQNLEQESQSVFCHKIIDASGRSSILLKQLGIKRKIFSEQLAAICWIKSSDNDQNFNTRIKSVKDGWWYSALLPDQTRVIAFYGLADVVAEKVRNPEMFVNSFNQTDIIPEEINQKDFLSSLKATKANVSVAEKPADKNWVAVGDAALSLDPLSSQGMFFALYSALKGTDILIQPEGSTEKLSVYEHKIQEVLKSHLNSRIYHYTSERRYLNAPYWKQALEEATSGFANQSVKNN